MKMQILGKKTIEREIREREGNTNKIDKNYKEP
jgi:hypothetical protein